MCRNRGRAGQAAEHFCIYSDTKKRAICIYLLTLKPNNDKITTISSASEQAETQSVSGPPAPGAYERTYEDYEKAHRRRTLRRAHGLFSCRMRAERRIQEKQRARCFKTCQAHRHRRCAIVRRNVGGRRGFQGDLPKLHGGVRISAGLRRFPAQTAGEQR